MKKRVAVLGWLLVTAGAVRAAEPAPPAQDPLIRIQFGSDTSSPPPENFTLAELNAALLAETNRVRVEHGCRPLRLLPALAAAAAADDQAAFMALTMRVAHTSIIPGQEDLTSRVKNRGLHHAALIAENALSTGFPPPRNPPPTCAAVAADLIAQWMDAPGHRANLLNRAFTDIGCAAHRVNFFGNRESIFATQVFAAR